MNQTIFKVLIVLSLGLGACGNSSNDPASSSASSSSSSVHKSYQYSSNGCDTQKQNFDGADAESVNKQICTALQDEKLNHSCAQDLRELAFKSQCPGQTFTPVYN